MSARADVAGWLLRCIDWLCLLALACATVAGVAMLPWVLAADARAATAAQLCPPWEPASAPYRGDPAAAVRRLAGIPEADRDTLAMMVGQGFSGQRVMVGRDGIVGANLAELRDMNGAGGKVCHGLVNRSHWPAGRHETGWAYTVGRTSIVVLDSCGNVAVATNLDALPPPATPSRETLRAQQAARGSTGLSSLVGLTQPRPQGGPYQVPEPGTLALLALAAIGAAAARRLNPSRNQPAGEHDVP